MKHWMSRVLLLVTVVGLGLAAGGCKEEGPLEKAGREADAALKKTAEAAKDAAEKTKEAVQ